jgi:hypothetical protein
MKPTGMAANALASPALPNNHQMVKHILMLREAKG